jgi:Protein of unknown function (DUF2490)
MILITQKIIKKKLIYFLILLSGYTFGQVNTKVDQFNSWISYTGNHKLTEKWGFITEYQFIRNKGFSKPLQQQVRIGLDCNLNKKVLVSFGWTHVETSPYGDFADEVPSKFNNIKFNEQRIWEQLALKHESIGRFQFDSRFRFEQRWSQVFKNFGSANEPIFLRYDDPVEGLWKYRQRVRYRFRVQLPLSNPEMIDNTLFLVVTDEIFVNFGKYVASNIFDQNRLSFALGWRFNKNFNTQLGYLNQFAEKGDGIHKENNHTLQIGIVYNIDFSMFFKKTGTIN